MQFMEQFQADVEHGSHKSQARFNVKLEPMMKFLGFANDSQHGERGFNHHAVIPRTFFADFDIIGQALGAAKAVVLQPKLCTGWSVGRWENGEWRSDATILRHTRWTNS